jgi:hypothetical protein
MNRYDKLDQLLSECCEGFVGDLVLYKKGYDWILEEYCKMLSPKKWLGSEPELIQELRDLNLSSGEVINLPLKTNSTFHFEIYKRSDTVYSNTAYGLKVTPLTSHEKLTNLGKSFQEEEDG